MNGISRLVLTLSLDSEFIQAEFARSNGVKRLVRSLSYIGTLARSLASRLDRQQAADIAR